jgi:hypothetical protein
MQYDVYLTEPEQNEESAERPLVTGVDAAAAQQLCRALNEGGYLRPGLVAHSVDGGKATSTNPVTVQALRDDWIDRPGLTEDDRAALAALPDEDLQAALDQVFEGTANQRMWWQVLDDTRGEATDVLLRQLGRDSSGP